MFVEDHGCRSIDNVAYSVVVGKTCNRKLVCGPNTHSEGGMRINELSS